MRFANALRGVKTLRIAALLSLCAAALSMILAFLGLFGFFGRLDALYALAFTVLFGLGLAVLVVRLVGVSQAARDQSQFAEARMVILMGIAFSLVGGLVFQRDSLPYVLLRLLVSVFSIWASILIIKGILAFAELFRYEQMLPAGKRLIRVVLIVESLAAVMELLRILLPSSLSTNIIPAMITIVSLALQLRELVLFLRYLKGAAEMLTIGNPALGRPGSVSPLHSKHSPEN